MRRFAPLIAVTGMLALGACAMPPPTGPSVVALPASGKDLSQFQQEDASCRAYASQLIGTGAGASELYTVQQRYDIAYTQCMYSKGNTVRSSGLLFGWYASYPSAGPLYAGTTIFGLGVSAGCCRNSGHHHGWSGGHAKSGVGPAGGWHGGGWHGGGARS
jgi:hypothetical protein